MRSKARSVSMPTPRSGRSGVGPQVRLRKAFGEQQRAEAKEGPAVAFSRGGLVDPQSGAGLLIRQSFEGAHLQKRAIELGQPSQRGMEPARRVARGGLLAGRWAGRPDRTGETR